MTGPEFATAHGNDSSTWTPADFDTEMNLAEIDLQPVWVLINRGKKTSPDTHPAPPAHAA